MSDASTSVSTSSRTPIKKISSITAPERMRAAVKEKDAKIEQLMKERHLERQEIAKAASQTEQVEENLEMVRKEYMTYKAKSTRQITDLHDEIQLKTKQHQELVSQVEDLQFRLEEAQLTLEDAPPPDQTADQLEALKSQFEEEKGSLKQAKDEIQSQMDNITLELESERTKSRDNESKCKQLSDDLSVARKSLEEQKEELSRSGQKLNFFCWLFVKKIWFAWRANQ